MVWMLERALKRRSARKHVVAAKTAEDVVAQQPDTSAPTPAEAPTPAPSPGREHDPGFDEIRKRVNEEVERNPEAAAEILRGWLAEGASATGNGATAPAPERSPT
jgi:flagellar biosynthesis/type III secretory pathway M-ring protein FliF/YscJ